MNTEAMFSSATDLWETPQYFFDALDAEFGFDLDVCAMPENAKCERFYTPDEDGLAQPWDGKCCWCNPPYGRQIGKWVKKGYETAMNGGKVVMLLPARTDTRWFHSYINDVPIAQVRFVKGRLRFGNSKENAPFPNMVVVFNKAVSEYDLHRARGVAERIERV